VGSTPWTSLPSVESVEYLVFQIVMQPNFVDIIKLATLLGKPIGDVEALINAGEFFGAGQNAGHYTYGAGMDAAINDALALGNSLPHQLGN
jgi:ABC-type taurine transport system substrate-binding protein